MQLDLQTAQLLREITPPPEIAALGMLKIGFAAVREGSRAVFHAYAGSEPLFCETEDVQVPAAAGSVPARLYHAPIRNWRARPLVVFFHGGGWFQGDVDCYDLFMRDLCTRSGANMLSVEYRLAPEHKYPAALEDGLTALNWAAQFVGTYGDAARLAVMGDSAGGNLATVIARRVHEEARVKLAAQILLYPMLDLSRPHTTYPSRMSFGGGEYLLTRDSLEAAMTWYLDGRGRPEDPDVSPLLAADLSKLPETILVIGGYDPLLDEAALYVQRLREAGVPTRFKCFETTIHAFLSFGVLDVARQGRAYIADEIKRCLFG
jgi:acetyl esterase